MKKIIFKITRTLFLRNQMESKALRYLYKRYRNISIGKYSYGCFTDAISEGTKIGNYCSFGPGVKIFNGNHGIKWASTHPFLYNTSFHIVENEQIMRTKLVVGHGVWVGANVIILPSVTSIGNGAIIGAGSVVTKNIKPYSINVGNPAKNIGFRFESNFIEILEEKCIYNYSKDDFRDNYTHMYEKEDFNKLNKSK